MEMPPRPVGRASLPPATSRTTSIVRPSRPPGQVAWQRSMPIAISNNSTRELVQTRLLTRIDDVAAAEWNALVGDYPFLRHEFLAALENTGCATARTGWRPRHLLL